MVRCKARKFLRSEAYFLYAADGRFPTASPGSSLTMEEP
jgi:hypothetical protein